MECGKTFSMKYASSLVLLSICFRLGHSSLSWLFQTNSHLVVFDSFEYQYTNISSSTIMSLFPDRITMLQGNTFEIVTNYANDYTNPRYALISLFSLLYPRRANRGNYISTDRNCTRFLSKYIFIKGG